MDAKKHTCNTCVYSSSIVMELSSKMESRTICLVLDYIDLPYWFPLTEISKLVDNVERICKCYYPLPSIRVSNMVELDIKDIETTKIAVEYVEE